jgi:hypothetical protein
MDPKLTYKSKTLWVGRSNVAQSNLTSNSRLDSTYSFKKQRVQQLKAIHLPQNSLTKMHTAKMFLSGKNSN